MDEMIEQYRQDFPRHLAALGQLEENTRLDAAERSAVQHALRFMRIMHAQPELARPLLGILVNEDEQDRLRHSRARTAIIWSRVDNTLRQSATATFNLGRVSQDMLAAAQGLAETAARLQPFLPAGSEQGKAMDEIEAVSHQLRAATRALSGSTPSAIKVDHEHLEKILAHWSPVDSVQALLACFKRLGIAWEEPAPLPAPTLRHAQARC